MLKYIFIEVIKYAVGPALLCIFVACRRKWSKIISVFQPAQVVQELSEDLGTTQGALVRCRTECTQLREKDGRREIAFEELFDQVQGYRLVRDRLLETIDRANIKMVKLQQELDMEGVHTSTTPEPSK